MVLRFGRACVLNIIYGDWSLHNQHYSGINDFLSLTAKLLKTFSLRYWWFTRSVLYKVAIHGSPWRCTRLSLLLDKPCNICFLPWAGKMINIGLFRRKSFGCLTRVVHKSSLAKLKPRHATPQKETNIGKNTTSSSEKKYIFYSPNTTHEWFRFKKRLEVR